MASLAPPRPAGSSASQSPHTLFDDVQGGLTAVVLVSLGLSLLASAGLMTGGTPGIAFLLSYVTGWPLGISLFTVNLPFYAIALRAFGARFTVKTALAIVALSLCVEVVRHVFSVKAAEPVYPALAGGVLIGVGLLILFRHNASFGGINVLALYLQKRCGWSPGRVQMVIDLVILGTSFAVLDVRRVGWSILGAVAVNAVLIWNHRPGRYRPS